MTSLTFRLTTRAIRGAHQRTTNREGVTDDRPDDRPACTGNGLAHSIVQIVNHGTAHRAETGLLLDRLGRSPGDLDYAYYCFEHP